MRLRPRDALPEVRADMGALRAHSEARMTTPAPSGRWPLHNPSVQGPGTASLEHAATQQRSRRNAGCNGKPHTARRHPRVRALGSASVALVGSLVLLLAAALPGAVVASSGGDAAVQNSCDASDARFCACCK